MPYSDLKTSDLNILLAITEDENVEKFYKTIGQIEFGLLTVVHSWKALLEEAKTDNYDVVITRTFLESEDVVAKIKESKLFKKYNLPVVFILCKDMVNSQKALIENIKVRFLQQQNLSKDLLEYVIKDIFYQNKLDTLTRGNELRYKNLFEHSFDINIIIDKEYLIIEGNQQYKVQVQKELPYDLESLFIYSKTFLRLTNLLENRENVRSFHAEFLLYNEPANCIIDSFKLFDLESEHIGYHLIIKDVDTEFRIQQLANRYNNLMATGKFMRSLAHEIRNPLTNIQLAMEQLKEDLEATEDSELFFGIMKRSSSRINELLNKLMNAFKSSEIIIQEEDLCDIVNRSIFLAKDRIALKEIKLTTTFNVYPAPVNADLEKMSMAFLNLIVNAIEAMVKQEKRIDIVIDYNKKGQLKLSIQDNAVGMNEEQLDNLFNPFYSGKATGVGLGLTTTQNIISAHKWEIDVESKLGEGTKFTITIP